MKEKKSKEEIKQSAGLFYYESIGMILLIISIISLTPFGSSIDVASSNIKIGASLMEI